MQALFKLLECAIVPDISLLVEVTWLGPYSELREML